MIKFETLNELALKVTCDSPCEIFTKTGAFITGRSFNGKNYKFEKRLLGPEGNPVQAAMHQVLRRFTGENLPLTVVKAGGPSETIYADEAKHVVVIQLQPGEQINVESENILAFTSSCKYGVRFLGTGVLSQKGLATSTLTGNGPDAFVAITVDGNPIVMSNEQDGSTIEVDPDAMVAFTGRGEPGMKLDVSWKNLIGQASGESYMFEWSGNRRSTVIIQPNERKSGLDISMDGKRNGEQPQMQNNPTVGQAMNQVGNTMQSAGNMMNQAGNTMNNMGNQNPMGGQGQGGIGDILGNLFR